MDLALLTVDNAYNLPAFSAKGTLCKTNLPATTSMRAPGVSQATLAMEHVIEDIADSLGMDPDDVRTANFLRIGDTTGAGKTLKYLTLPTVWSELMDNADFAAKQKQVATFNANNR